MKKPYIIAEIGVNFYDTAKVLDISLLEAAKKYIKEAKEAGTDAVKFQSYKADTIVSKNSPAYWDLTKEPTKTQHDLFLKHDSFGEEDYIKLYKYAKEINVDFMSTPFDFQSADYLENMMDIYKISSSDLTNIPFIRHIAKKGKPVYLSTGASYISEIENAVRVLQEEGCTKICLLHCVLSYPTKNEDANLNMIKHLKDIFPNVEIGYSDHTMPDETMTIITTAYLLGANIIEKHFTLDKTLLGNDHYHSMDSNDLKKIIQNLNLIQLIVGQTYKTVLECESIPRLQARRSIVVVNDMTKGDIIRSNNIMLKRPGTGISPADVDKIIGRPILKNIKADTVLKWEDI